MKTKCTLVQTNDLIVKKVQLPVCGCLESLLSLSTNIQSTLYVVLEL